MCVEGNTADLAEADRDREEQEDLMTCQSRAPSTGLPLTEYRDTALRA